MDESRGGFCRRRPGAKLLAFGGREISAMRFLVAFAALAAFVSTATSQEVVKFENQVAIGVGESRVMQFKAPFATINVLTKDIASVSALTDQTLAITGQQPGSTVLLVQDQAGRTLYSALVTVNADTGGIVKIYGLTGQNGGGTKDYTSFYCTDVTCGRADKELGGAREPNSVTVRRPLAGGGFVETTNQR